MAQAVVSYQTEELINISLNEHSPAMLVPQSPPVARSATAQLSHVSHVEDSLENLTALIDPRRLQAPIAAEAELPDTAQSNLDQDQRDSTQHVETGVKNIGVCETHNHTDVARKSVDARLSPSAVTTTAHADIEQVRETPDESHYTTSRKANALDAAPSCGHKQPSSRLGDYTNPSQAKASRSKLHSVPRSALDKLHSKRQGLASGTVLPKSTHTVKLEQPQRHKRGKLQTSSGSKGSIRDRSNFQNKPGIPKANRASKTSAASTRQSRPTVGPLPARGVIKDTPPVASRLRSKRSKDTNADATTSSSHKELSTRNHLKWDMAQALPSDSRKAGEDKLSTPIRRSLGEDVSVVSTPKSSRSHDDPYAIPELSPARGKGKAQPKPQSPRQVKPGANSIVLLQTHLHDERSNQAASAPASHLGQDVEGPTNGRSTVEEKPPQNLPTSLANDTIVSNATPHLTTGEEKSRNSRSPPQDPSHLGDFLDLDTMCEMPSKRDTTAAAILGRHEAVGASQQDPIAISEDESSSSYEDEPLPRGLRPSATRTMPHSRPVQTITTETPPRLAPSKHSLTTSQERKSVRAHKTTIIGFANSGPLNQGSTSVRHAAKGRESSLPAVKGEVTDRLSNLVTRPEEMRHSRGPSSTAASARTDKSRSSYQSNVANNVSDALTGLLKKRSAAEPLQPQPKPKRQKRYGASESKLVRAQKDGLSMQNIRRLQWANVVDDDEACQPSIGHNEDTLMETGLPIAVSVAQTRTASQLAMPPPPKTSERAAKDHVVMVHPTKHVPEPSTDELIKQPRSNENLPTVRSEIRSVAGRASNNINLLLSPTRKSPLFTPTNPSKRRKLQKQQHGNQGKLQTVDVGGSPVPLNMDISPKRTVLEAFSQESKLSSDESDLGNLLDDTTLFDVASPVEPYSQTLIKPQNPIVSLPQSTILPSTKSLWSTLPIPNSNPSAIAVSNSKAKTRLVETPRHLQVIDPLISSSTSPRLILPKPVFFKSITQNLDNKIGKLRNQLSVPQPVSQCLDKHRDVDTKELDDERTTTKQTLAAGISAVSQEPEADVANLETWRNALKPHQLNLFDELLNVAHRVTQHLVDEEIATANMLEDYRRRSMTIVEKMERHHIRMYTRLETSLRQRRRQVRREAQEYVEMVDGCTKAVRDARAQHDQRMTERERANRELEAFIEEMS